MKRIALILVAVCWFGLAQAEESSGDGEGFLGVDIGFSWGHFYGSPFPDALGANIGFHYEPALTQELNLVVAAKYHAMYWADNDGTAEENILYHLPQAGVGVKYLIDAGKILPFFGAGFTMTKCVRPEQLLRRQTEPSRRCPFRSRPVPRSRYRHLHRRRLRRRLQYPLRLDTRLSLRRQ